MAAVVNPGAADAGPVDSAEPKGALVATSGEVVAAADAEVEFVGYKDEHDMPGIVELIEKDLSEPYSIFTYRYFINNWPQLCFLAMSGDKCVGAVVCKLDLHRCRNTHRGYIAMLAVDKSLRGKGIGSKLVNLSLDGMRDMNADECVLEAEVTNEGALILYRNMGFVKEKRLHKYYLNGNDAFRLKFLFKLPEGFPMAGCLGPPAPNGSQLEDEHSDGHAQGHGEGHHDHGHDRDGVPCDGHDHDDQDHKGHDCDGHAPDGVPCDGHDHGGASS